MEISNATENNGLDIAVTEAEVAILRERGYNDDVLPKTAEKRNMDTKNYFTLWMGSVHNIPNYTAVGGFLFLGLSPINVMLAIVLSALAVATFMVYNGKARFKIWYSICHALTFDLWRCRGKTAEEHYEAW